ncbi:MAG: 4Fe-4S dicluster domain-containing protein [Bacteroidales bacterium]
MSRFSSYISSIGKAFYSLAVGMYRTVHSLVHPKLVLTQQYPDNRKTLYTPTAFKASLAFHIDENGVPKCTACGLCQMSCPNGSISLTSRSRTLEDGRTKRQIDTYVYHLGSCTFCGLCVDACRFGAIEFNNQFEQSQYLKENLEKVLYKNSEPTDK